jgi:hypothetical protein
LTVDKWQSFRRRACRIDEIFNKLIVTYSTEDPSC